MESVELTKLPISVQGMLDDYILVRNGIEIKTFRDAFLGATVYKIETYILAEEIDCRTKVVSIKTTYPVYQNWWQHFKGEVFPDWLKRHFPPRFNDVVKVGKKRVTFRRYATYPKANILFPKEVGELVKYKSFIEEE